MTQPRPNPSLGFSYSEKALHAVDATVDRFRAALMKQCKQRAFESDATLHHGIEGVTYVVEQKHVEAIGFSLIVSKEH